LNVLISRARERCAVFSSIVADDIDLRRAKSRGAQALKTFLHYAQTGQLDAEITAARRSQSEFERAVSSAVRSRGYTVHSQVGVAGFYIDLAIVDPDCPGRYVLGIECDGAMYHAARSARDRDRLRQQVLEDRGWILQRVWSTDWFRRPEEQLQKLLAAIDNAQAAWAARNGHHQRADRDPASPAVIPRHNDVTRQSPEMDATTSVPYEEAEFPVDTTREVHEVPVKQLASVVARIAEIEGPIHHDEITRRVAALWGLKRTGNRIGNAVEAALAEAVHDGRLVQRGLFFQKAGQFPVPLRNREEVRSVYLRKPDYLPPAEIRAALLAVVRMNLGVAREELVTQVARLLGFKVTSSQLHQVIDDEIRLLLSDGDLEQRNDKVYHENKLAEA
jgi:very-short-patch-repair endonuclease